MQPYQEASESVREHGELPIRAAKKLGSAALSGLGFAGGQQIIGRVLPLLSKFIPPDLATKGLSKVDPRFGQFIDKVMKSGKSFDEIREFLGDKFGGDEQPPPPPQQQRNIVEQYSPELHQFLLGEIEKGRSPIQAGALAELESTGKKGFKKIIDKITKQHKAPWSAILETVYGKGDQKQNTSNTQQPQDQEQIDPQLAKLFEQGNELIKQYRGRSG